MLLRPTEPAGAFHLYMSHPVCSLHKLSLAQRTYGATGDVIDFDVMVNMTATAKMRI